MNRSKLYIVSKVIFLLWLGIQLSSCSSRRGLGALDLNHVYQKEGNSVQPQIRIYNVNSVVSNVYFSLPSDELLYARVNTSSPYTANLQVQVFVYENFNAQSIQDTFSFEFSESVSELISHPISGSIPIEINTFRPLKQYVLLIRFYDKNRKQYFDGIRILERTDPFSNQNYLVLSEDSTVVFGDHIELNTTYKIIYNSEVDSLRIGYYNREFKPGLPPFSKIEGVNFNHTPDSSFSIQNGSSIKFHQPGFYHFLSDTSENEGMTLYNFSNHFPRLTKKADLIGPMRYLTSNLEFEGIDLINADSAKLAIDKFWLTHAGSEERAREQVQEYYERVEAANVFFSSYKAGWMTDRGVLYIIYGPPTKIYKTLTTETWVYGEESSSLNFTFVFDKMNNPYSDNDFGLRRSPAYRFGWGMGIDEWRHGKTFDATDIKKAQDARDQQLRQAAPPYLWY